MLWKSFEEIQGVLIGFLGIFIGIIFARFPFKTSIPLDLTIVIAFFSLLFLFTLLNALYTLFIQNRNLQSQVVKLQESNQNLKTQVKQRIRPKILKVVKDPNTGFILYLLIEYSELFVNDLMISFIYTDEYGNEATIGIGFIETIQNNGLMKAVINQPKPNLTDQAYLDILDKLANENKTVLDRIIVIPGITKIYLNLN